MKDFKKIHLEWNWQLSSSPRELWPLVSDANRLFKNINLPAVQHADISSDQREGRLQLSYDSINNSDAWIEEPYQWEYPYRFGVKRLYKNGSYRDVIMQVDLHPNKKGTRLQYQLWITPGNAVFSYFSILKLKTMTRRKIRNYFRHSDESASRKIHPYRLESPKRLSSGASSRIDEISTVLCHKTGHNKTVKQLIDFITRADDIDLHHINPLLMAREWGLNKKEVLDVFLHAAKEGLLNFNWNLHCPSCRTIQRTCRTLSEVHEPVFCHDCSREFKVNFNRSIQLSFRPNPLIRKISNKTHSMEGPHRHPHVVVQQVLKPGRRRYLYTDLEEGTYYLRSSKTPGRATINVHSSGEDTVDVVLTDSGMAGQVTIVNRPNLTFINDTAREQVFQLERAEWDGEILTASHVTSLQIFRDLFANEVLRKGEKISVDRLTLMFTDLYDSTSMYHREGDDRAVSRVIEHFEILQEAVAREDGALVKTIGDSVMAVFSTPVQAMRAFINAQQIISRDDRFNKTLQLKAGIHHGSCVAVNLNNKIDYFGSTVNIASRLVDSADVNEVMVSENVFSDINVADLLKEELGRCTVNKEKASLKGFKEEEFRLKRISMQRSALRLVI